MGLALALALVAPHQELMAAGPAPVVLGTTAQFTILSGAAITTTGGGVIQGNVGASPIAGSAIHLTQAQVIGTIYTVDASGPAGSVDDPTLLSAAKGDLTIAINDAKGRTPVPTGAFLNPNGGNIGGLNLVAGLYKFTSTAYITGASVTLTGGPNDVWIFQCAADLEVGSSVQVILAGGAQAGNVFWQVGTSATIGTFAVFNGTILANQAITMDTSSVMNGRALAFSAGVTFDGTSGTLPTPQNPAQGSLQVDLTPFLAVGNGAEWQVDGGPSQVSGFIMPNLSPGIHIVSFKPVNNFITPANQNVTIISGQTTIANGFYAALGGPAGSLTVNLLPQPQIAAAQWQVDGGADESTGDTVNNLAPGNHLVTFTPVAGWITPANQTVTIVNNQTTTTSSLYILIGPGLFGSLNVNLLPAGAVSGGALWQVDGGPDQTTGTTIANLAPGNYTVSFVPIFDWIAPPDEIVMITAGAVTDVSGLYAATNSFIFAHGIYNGLFSTTNGVTEQTAGMLKSLTIGTNGIYSGKILINGASYVIRGTFNTEGQASNTIPRAARLGGPVTVAMTVDVNQPFPQVTGPVSGTNGGLPWVANLVADQASNTVPAAEYTMLLPPDTNNNPPTLSPGGDGYFLITNYTGTVRDPAAATVRITGALADGTVFNQLVPVSQDGYVPIYASLYANKGLLLGWINLYLTNTDNVSLTWIRPQHASGMYQGGFTNVALTNQILLSLWADPPASVDLLTDLSTRETIDDPVFLANYNLTISPALDFANVVALPIVGGSINRKTGFFRVTLSVRGTVIGDNVNAGTVLKGNEGIVTNGNGETVLTSFNGTPLVGSEQITLIGYGAILQNATNGGGYFLTTTNGKAIQLNP